MPFSINPLENKQNSVNKTILLIVEDHEMYRNVLLNVLSRDQKFHIAGIARTAEEGLEKLKEFNVDLVLVDVGLPGMDGIDFVKLVHDQYPDLRCAMLSGYHSAVYVQRSLQAGARGYLLKDNPAGILEGIQKVLNGETYVSKELGEVNFGFLPD